MHGMDAGRDAAGVEAFGDLDQHHHRVVQIGLAVRVEAVGLAHQLSGTDQQVPKSRASANATVAVVGSVIVGHICRELPIPGEKHAFPGYEDLIEDHHAGRLAVLVGEQRVAMLGLFSRMPGGTGDDRDAERIDRDRATHSSVEFKYG